MLPGRGGYGDRGWIINTEGHKIDVALYANGGIINLFAQEVDIIPLNADMPHIKLEYVTNLFKLVEGLDVKKEILLSQEEIQQAGSVENAFYSETGLNPIYITNRFPEVYSFEGEIMEDWEIEEDYVPLAAVA